MLLVLSYNSLINVCIFVSAREKSFNNGEFFEKLTGPISIRFSRSDKGMMPAALRLCKISKSHRGHWEKLMWKSHFCHKIYIRKFGVQFSKIRDCYTIRHVIFEWKTLTPFQEYVAFFCITALLSKVCPSKEVV